MNKSINLKYLYQFILSARVIFLIILSFLLFNQCVLLHINEEKNQISQELREMPDLEDVDKNSFSLNFLELNNNTAEVLIRLSKCRNTQIKTEIITKGIKKKKLLDNWGRMKFYFIGPAWVTEDFGMGRYVLTLGFSAVMSLSLSVFIAIGDWVSLPFRLIDSNYIDTQWINRNISEKCVTLDVENSTIIKLFNRDFITRDSKIIMEKSFLVNVIEKSKQNLILFQVIHMDNKYYETQKIDQFITKSGLRRIRN